jgi:phosphohistidine phosphatase
MEESDNAIRLIVVRHGDTEQETGVPDDSRRLTKKGKKQLKRTANFMDKMNYNIENIVSSPLIRSRESAEVIVDELGLDLKIDMDDSLKPDADVASTVAFIKTLKDNTIIVGHNPNLSLLLNKIAGFNGELKKAGIAVLQLDKTTMKSDLELLLDQKVLKLI